MAEEPVIAPVQQVEAAIHTTPGGFETPPPSPEREHLADDVFTRDEAEVTSSLLSAQAALVMTHNLLRDAALDAREKEAEDEEERRRRRPQPPLA